MATEKMICRVCGKEYQGCCTTKIGTSGFRWQEVACSPECGSIYLAKIEASRAVKPIEKKVTANNAEKVKDIMDNTCDVIDNDDLVDDEDFILDEDLDD